MKVVILSAGQGKRLSPLTDDRPKCLVELSGRTVLHWQLAHLASVGVSEAVVVTVSAPTGWTTRSRVSICPA